MSRRGANYAEYAIEERIRNALAATFKHVIKHALADA